VKRGIGETLKRGFENTLANWPLILLRLAEILVMFAVMFGAVMLIVVPIALSFGVNASILEAPDELAQVLLSKWLLLVYILAIILGVLVLLAALHSFVEAGSARVYVDAERLAGPSNAGGRQRFRVFSMERWISGAKEGWWPVFWIYNATYGLAAMILLIPLLPTLIFMLMFREEPGAMAITGCLGLAMTLMLMIAVGLIVGIWTTRAIATWAARRGGVRDTLSAAWAGFKADIGRHVLVALVILVISFAVSGFFSSFGIFAAFAEMAGKDSPSTLLFTMPLRFVGSLLSTIVSVAISAWFLASFTAIATER
jgi:hypothetical protein